MDRLRSDSVTLHYGEAPAVRELSLAIPEGSITSIIGPNGCGKSTLLRALARLMRPAGGAVYPTGNSSTTSRRARSPGASGCCTSRRSRRTGCW
jgi:iron complex transport system ATP-binding protein